MCCIPSAERPCAKCGAVDHRAKDCKEKGIEEKKEDTEVKTKKKASVHMVLAHDTLTLMTIC